MSMPERDPLTHFDEAGRAHMVDVGGKVETHRVAVAGGTIVMQASTLERIAQGQVAKGDVLAVARVAGIQGAKRTAELIPLCHPLPLSDVQVRFAFDDALPGIRCETEARTVAATGVEMEAITAAVIALTTIYDMAKSVDKGMRIEGVRLLEKTGGKSGTWRAEDAR